MPRRLPPGQYQSNHFHRFGLSQFAKRFPKETHVASIKVTGSVECELHVSDALKALPRVEQDSDFHCVTTWSVCGLKWGGVRFADVYEHIILPQAKPLSGATLVVLKAQDGARTGMLLEDLLASDVLLADQLNGEPLSVDHGAPIRLVAPAHYAYKSVKYLCELRFVDPAEGYSASGLKFMDHLRARVALEERGRGVPGFILRYLYRLLVKPTAVRFAKASAAYRKKIDN